MNTISEFVDYVVDKTNFVTLASYLTFAERFLLHIGSGRDVQARIVSRKETQYQFIQYTAAGHHNFTRPLNTELLYEAEDFPGAVQTLRRLLPRARIHEPTNEERSVINRTVYTAQQAIGATLDALPSGRSNTARKINGDLFERLIRILINELGISCTSGSMMVPLYLDGKTVAECSMSYQHDLIIKEGDSVKAIGSVKTSSKDRIDKIFVDKFLFNRLTEKDVPHIAIFLNDVQRVGKEPNFRIASTFLPGHFKGYTIKLNPLDGVYYCDIRPNMRTESILMDHIRTLDYLVFNDIWSLISRDAVVAEVISDESDDSHSE